MSIANASQHLQRLRRAGLLTSRKHRQQVLYSLSDDSVLKLLAALRRVATHNLAEARQLIETYFRERDRLEPLSRKELWRRMRSNEITLVDVRSPEEFVAGHLPGAVSIPIGDLRRRLTHLPRSQEIVAYCRGPYCVFSYEAVAELRKHGFHARRLEDGYPEWKAGGLPIETSAPKDDTAG